jgi:hypothetical protein
MTARYILQEALLCEDGVEFEMKDLLGIPEFMFREEESSMESLGMLLAGHSPIMNYSFSEAKFMKWCEEYNLQCAINAKDQMVYLKQKK